MAPKKFTTSNNDLFSFGKIEVGLVRSDENRPIVILDREGIRLHTSSGTISEGDGIFQLTPVGGTMTMRGKNANTGNYDMPTVYLKSGSGGNGGQLILKDNYGKTAIQLTGGNRELTMFAATGNSATIRLDGQAGTIYGSNADIAENFACWQEHKDYEPDSEGWAEITDPIEPGDVLVISDDGKLVKCSTEYDRRVAGVVSGGGRYKPAIILDDVDVPGTEEYYDGKGIFPIALAGKVYCKVTGEVKAGDLLVTSPKKGFAMRADPKATEKIIGAILGKALVSKPPTTSPTLIPILVMLG